MKNKLIYPLIATVLLTGAACRGDRKTAVSQQEFEAVQEGSAAGVTSTINGPGETIPPMTGTNADTTTAFALNTAGQPMAGQPGTVAGTLPAQPYPSQIPTGTYVPSMPAPAPVTRQPIVITRRPATPEPIQPTEPQPVPQQPTETVEPVPPPPPSQTDTTATQPPPPPAQTTTAQPPKQEKKPPAEQNEQEEQTDTAEPPPPPSAIDNRL